MSSLSRNIEMLCICQMYMKEDNETFVDFHVDSRNKSQIAIPELYVSPSMVKNSFSFYSARFVTLFMFLVGPPLFSTIY